jgi:chaperonin cofactor prefoldin
MSRCLFLVLAAALFIATSVAAQSSDPGSTQSASQPKDSSAPADAKKTKKVWTNENLSDANGGVSVVGDAQNKPKGNALKTANTQDAASIRKQLEKLQKQLNDVDKQLRDLKSLSEGEPPTSASGIKLGQHYNRDPIEVQMRALQDKKKDLQSKIDALLDEARKKGVEPGQLR